MPTSSTRGNTTLENVWSQTYDIIYRTIQPFLCLGEILHAWTQTSATSALGIESMNLQQNYYIFQEIFE